MKKHRWRAWDSNPGQQDGRRRWFHWAMAAPQRLNIFNVKFNLASKHASTKDKIFSDFSLEDDKEEEDEDEEEVNYGIGKSQILMQQLLPYLPTYLNLPTYTYLPISLLTYLPSALLTYRHTYTYQPTYLYLPSNLPTFCPTYLSADLPTDLPTSIWGGGLKFFIQYFPFLFDFTIQYYKMSFSFGPITASFSLFSSFVHSLFDIRTMSSVYGRYLARPIGPKY